MNLQLVIAVLVVFLAVGIYVQLALNVMEKFHVDCNNTIQELKEKFDLKLNATNQQLHKEFSLKLTSILKQFEEVTQKQEQTNGALENKLIDEVIRRKSLEVMYHELKEVVSLDANGASYIRWGRQSCSSNGSHMVYKGFASGAHYNIQGAAANYLCLPEDPLWSVYEDAEQTGHTIWGAEYEFHYRNMNAFFGKPLAERDVPCSVCHTKRASVLMIPGRNKCYDGWTLEYHGYLMAGHGGHPAASEFVCLDADPEALVGGIEDQDGKLFYFVEARCGSLRCPPYVNGRELTCAVCSK